MKQGREAVDKDPVTPELGSDGGDARVEAEVGKKTATKEKP